MWVDIDDTDDFQFEELQPQIMETPEGTDELIKTASFSGRTEKLL